MSNDDNTARIAGLLYLLMGLPVAFDLMFVRPTLVKAGDPSATAANILAAEPLFRLGLVGHVVSSVAAVLLIAAVYRLFEPFGRTLTQLTAWFLLLSVPITLLNLVHGTAALVLIERPEWLAAPQQATDTAALLLLTLQRHGVILTQVLWGVWLIPLGLLVMRCGWMPRLLGILLIIAGVAYVAASLTWLLVPSISRVISLIGVVPEALAEISLVAWLLIKGAGKRPPTPIQAKGK